MKRNLFFLFLLFFGVIDAGALDGGNAFSEKFEKTFNFVPGGRVNVTAMPVGDVKIRGWDRNHVSIEAKKTISGALGEDPALLMKNLKIKIKTDQVESWIAATSSLPPTIASRIDYTIHVPAARTDLNVVANEGAITVEGIEGTIEVRTLRGDVKLIDLKGFASSTTRTGNVHIYLAGPQWKGGALSAVTEQGNITLAIPRQYSTILTAVAKKGKIGINYPPQIIDDEEIHLKPVVKKKSSSIMCPLGAGGPPIRVHSKSGDINIVVREPSSVEAR